MSRLDRHITFVQSKLALYRFIEALALGIIVWLAVTWLVLLVGRLIQIYLPHPQIWVIASGGVMVLAAGVWGVMKKPSAHLAAVAIDQRLNLHEKYSTALLYRSSSDAFAHAAVLDAEKTAEQVSLSQTFPFTFPRVGYGSVAAACVLLLTFWFMPKFDLIGHEEHARQANAEKLKKTEAREVVKRAPATVNSYPKAMQSNANIQLAKRDLENLLNQPVNDPSETSRTAFKALQQSNEALKEEIKRNDQFATAKSNEQMMKSMAPADNEQGPVADAQRNLAKGDIAKAMQNLAAASQKFDQMSDGEKQKTANQMQNLAKQMQQMAQNPAQSKQLQNQLQQMGATAQQAQQMTQMMQQAAQGNPQAQQQLQQLKQQLTQQMQQQSGSPSQQAKMQQVMKQMQAQANTQATAQQMAQAAQQMAQAMQQGVQQQQQQQQSQSQQSANSKMGSAGKSQSPSNQNGQKGQQQQQMAGAQEQMQQAMGQMDAVQKDAEEMSAAQDSSQQAAEDAASQAGGSPAPSGAHPGRPKNSDATGQWQQSNGGKPGQGQGAGGAGNGAGGRPGYAQAPYSTHREVDPSQNIDSGRILASTFVKAGTIKGESKIQLSQTAESAMKDSTDDVDEEGVSKDSEKAVKQYFETMQKGD